jgi:SAM-dependent methyltransferase
MKTTCHAPHCPLCRGEHIDPFHEDDNRIYLNCLNCGLVFVPRCDWPSDEAEKATYDLHENDPLDPRYRRFLSRFVSPLVERLKPNQKGLDFGCGPGPTLSILLEAHGHRVDLYDPIYHNDARVFDNTYDFICATEVVEHLRDPRVEFAALFKMLKPGGWLGIMTKLVKDKQAFRHWHYIRDMTHICFYSTGTFEDLAQRFDARLEIVANDVILLKKKSIVSRLADI